MSKPEVWSQKPKPDATCARLRLNAASQASMAATAATSTQNRTCHRMLRARGSRSSGIAGGGLSAEALAMDPLTSLRSADRRRVLQPALRPQRVHAAANLEQ